MGERGGRNLYSFALNNSINYFDILGLMADPYPFEVELESNASYLNPVGRFIKFYTGFLGTVSHTAIMDYIDDVNTKYNNLQYDRPLKTYGFISMRRPDIISRDMDKNYLWEIKPITHKAPSFWDNDDSQIERYLEQITDKCYSMGDSRDFFNTPHEDLPDDYNVKDMFGNEFSIRVYPGENYGRKGFIFYGLRLEESNSQNQSESVKALEKEFIEAGEETRKLLEKYFPLPGGIRIPVP